jgi:hypothetical protein
VILTSKEILSAVITAVMSNKQSDRDDACKLLQGHILAVEAERDALAAELAECRNSRQREHDLRVTLAGELESFKIRYQDEVSARVNAENELDAVRSGFVAELRKTKEALAGTRMAFLHQSGLLAQARELLARYGTLSEWDKDYAPAIDAFLGSPSRPDNLSIGSAPSDADEHRT